MQPPPSASSPGTLRDWRTLALRDDILPEKSPDGGLALWLPGERKGGLQYWERVSVVPRSEFTAAPGVYAAPASAVMARQALGGPVHRLWRQISGAASGITWLIPGGASAEQCGERRTDLLLMWAEDTASLDVARVRALWPTCSGVRQLGKALFLVEGVRLSAGPEKVTPAAGTGCPRQLAEHLLADARSSGDPRKEAVARTDLGLIELNEGHTGRAIELLEEARSVARGAGDRALECDTLVHLGLALILADQPRRALPLLDQALPAARERGDRFAEKLALERLGLAHAHLHEPARALAYFEQALALASATGDRKQQAELHWHVAVQHAEAGRVDWSLTHARAAVELLEEMQDPRASVFADHLRRFQSTARSPATAGGLGATTASPAPPWGGTLVISAGSATPATGLTGVKDRGPGILKMAFTAALSAARFAGSGLRVVPDADLQRRLKTCAACEQHTGLRCRLCGCFTNVKARMPHEKCPAGKW